MTGGEASLSRTEFEKIEAEAAREADASGDMFTGATKNYLIVSKVRAALGYPPPKADVEES